MKQIAIIGSGPAGCYLAEQLLRTIPESTVDVLESLPVPFGLARYGVAPDHQATKAVIRVLDRILSNSRIAFFGNVEVGRDISLDELLAMYDAVVLATGAVQDRKLNIPGEDLPGVIASSEFVGCYNAHPRSIVPQVGGVSSAVIIGNGNVALDVARILARDDREFAGSDIAPEFFAWLQDQSLSEIHILGRRTPAEAKFSEHELSELGRLARAQARVVEASDLDSNHPIITVLREFEAAPPRSAPIAIHFHFSTIPTSFSGSDCLQSVCCQRNGREFRLRAQLAVTCAGYQASACCRATPLNGHFPNHLGRIEENLYVVGWAKRGASGTIPTNRAEAQQLAQYMAKELTNGSRPGRAGLLRHLGQREVRFIDYAAWKRIDAAELACAPESRCRKKFRSVPEMLRVALGSNYG